MSHGCDPIADALDAAPAPVDVFFRDDDAGWGDARLIELLDLLRRARHAARPGGDPGERSTPALARELRGRGAASACTSTATRTSTTSPRAASASSGRRARGGAAARHRGRPRAAGRAARGPRRPDLHAAVEPLHARRRAAASPSWASRRSRASRARSRWGSPGLRELPVQRRLRPARRGRGRARAAGWPRRSVVGGPVGVMFHHEVMDGADMRRARSCWALSPGIRAPGRRMMERRSSARRPTRSAAVPEPSASDELGVVGGPARSRCPIRASRCRSSRVSRCPTSRSRRVRPTSRPRCRCPEPLPGRAAPGRAASRRSRSRTSRCPRCRCPTTRCPTSRRRRSRCPRSHFRMSHRPDRAAARRPAARRATSGRVAARRPAARRVVARRPLPEEPLAGRSAARGAAPRRPAAGRAAADDRTGSTTAGAGVAGPAAASSDMGGCASAARAAGALALVPHDLRGAAAGDGGRHHRGRHLRGRPAADAGADSAHGPREPAQQRHRDQRRGGVADGPPRPVDELADRPGAHPQVGCDLLVAVAVERVADDHLPLLRRQRAHRADHRPQPLAALHASSGRSTPSSPSGSGASPACGSRATLSAALCATRYSQGRSDDRRLRGLARQRRVGVDERLLERVVGGRRRQVAADSSAAAARDSARRSRRTPARRRPGPARPGARPARRPARAGRRTRSAWGQRPGIVEASHSTAAGTCAGSM